jgi:hypothetical protein
VNKMKTNSFLQLKIILCLGALILSSCGSLKDEKIGGVTSTDTGIISGSIEYASLSSLAKTSAPNPEIAVNLYQLMSEGYALVSTYSSDDLTFKFSDLKAGTYALEILEEKFGGDYKGDIVLKSGASETVNLRLTVVHIHYLQISIPGIDPSDIVGLTVAEPGAKIEAEGDGWNLTALESGSGDLILTVMIDGKPVEIPLSYSIEDNSVVLSSSQGELNIEITEQSLLNPPTLNPVGYIFDSRDLSETVYLDGLSGGYWFSFDDQPSGGTSTIAPANSTSAFNASRLNNGGVIKLEATLGIGFDFPYAGIGFNWNADGTPVDISEHQGLCISFASNNPVRVKMIQDTPDAYDTYGYRIEPPSGVRVITINIPFSSMSQEGWGTPYTADYSKQIGVQFQVMGVAPLSYDFEIHNITWGELCEATPIIPVSSSSLSLSSSSNVFEYPNPTCQGNFTGSIFSCNRNETQINNGEGAGGNLFSFDDVTSGGLSSVVPAWGVATVDILDFDGVWNSDLTIVPGIDFAFAGVGFNWSGEQTPQIFDASAHSGLCIEYTSNQPISLKLTQETIPDYDHYQVQLPIANTLTRQSLPWGQFSQEGWGAPAPLDLHKFLAVEFSMMLYNSGLAGVQNNLQIHQIGWAEECGIPLQSSSSSAALSSSSTPVELEEYTAQNCLTSDLSIINCNTPSEQLLNPIYPEAGYLFTFSDLESNIPSFIRPETSAIPENLNSNEGVLVFQTLLGDSDYPYSGLGFNWLNSNPTESYNISLESGFCIAYESNAPMELHIKQGGIGETEYDDYQVLLPTQTTPGIRKVLFANFFQEGWGIPYSLDLTDQIGVHFIFDNFTQSGTNEIAFALHGFGFASECE